MGIFWTEYSPLESNISATDPLALDYMAQQLGYLTLPNFTGRTSRARYYPMVCYGLYICEEIILSDNLLFNDRTVMSLFELYEKYWAYAVVASYVGEMKERDSRENGLRGKRGAIKAYNGNKRSLGDEYRLISRQLELGGLGAYRSSLERFGLIKKSSLSLTMQGREMAESFLPLSKHIRTQYRDLIMNSIKGKKIIEKQGLASIFKFGEYASLDYYDRFNQDHDERALLRKIIIESDPVTHATAKLASPMKSLWETNILDFFEKMATINTAEQSEAHVRDCFMTIYQFELLSIQINNAFCLIVQAAFEQGGKINIKDLASIVRPILTMMYEQNIPLQLVQTPKFHEITGYYYGTEFLNLISLLNTRITYDIFIQSLLKLHRQVENKRKSGVWVDTEHESIIAFSGYGYARSNMNRQHTFKIDNLFSLMNDSGWSS